MHNPRVTRKQNKKTGGFVTPRFYKI